jgi:hypothetical protein
MLLTPPEAALFFKLHPALMWFVNQRLRVLPYDVANPDDARRVVPEDRVKVRNALLQHRELIDSFVAENPAQLTAEELEVVRSWKHLVAGKFYIFRELKSYTVFLSTGDKPVAYGVVALTDPFDRMTGPDLPVLVETALLPFRDKIVYDGVLGSYRISFGTGIRRMLNESYKQAKARHGIVTTLSVSDRPPTASRPKAAQPERPAKERLEEAVAEIGQLVDRVCRECLNEEYAVLCRKLLEKLARKRPSPLLKGKPNTWASGIVRTIGWVNFLSDPSQTPHMTQAEVDAAFGISESAGWAKLKAIRDMFRIRSLEPDWTLPSRLADNPLAWMVTVNGLMIDLRSAPRHVQELAFQKGLIPYVPGERESD